MTRLLGAVLTAALVCSVASPAHAGENKDAKAILDKAIGAMGGEQKLSAIKALTSKSNGKISIQGTERDISNSTTTQGLTRVRTDSEVEFEGNKIHAIVVLNGDKGWFKFGEMGSELEADRYANEKRVLYLQVIPITIVPLKSKEFKVEMAADDKVDGKPAVGIKVTGPDGKDFQLFFDKETGLPVKQVAKVLNFMGEETNQETTFGGYKDFDGIKKATKVAHKRDGEKYLNLEITEFKVLDKVDPKTFDEPK